MIISKNGTEKKYDEFVYLIAYTYQEKKPSLNLTVEDLDSLQESPIFPPESLALTLI
jgi:hypothetical protein